MNTRTRSSDPRWRLGRRLGRLEEIAGRAFPGHPDCVPNPQPAPAKNAAAQSAMAQHRRDAAAAERLLHTGAGMAEGARFEQGFTHNKALIAKRMQIDVAHHQIAAQRCGVYAIPPQEMCGLVDELPGNNCYLTSRARGFVAAMVALEAMLSDRLDRIDDAHVHAPSRA